MGKGEKGENEGRDKRFFRVSYPATYFSR